MVGNRSSRINKGLLKLDRYIGRRSNVPLRSSPWIRSLSNEEYNLLKNLKDKYPLTSTAYEIAKQSLQADDIKTMSKLKTLDPPISWNRIGRFITSTSMHELLEDKIEGIYLTDMDRVPKDRSFLSLVRAGRLDLVQDRLATDNAYQYEKPRISTILLKELIPTDAIEWLIATEHWDGTPLARAILLDRYEELADYPLDMEAMELILYYDAYSVYNHYKVEIMKNPELVRWARGDIRKDMLGMYPIVIHAVDDPYLTVDDLDIMMETSLGTMIEKEVWTRARDLNMTEIVDKYWDEAVSRYSP